MSRLKRPSKFVKALLIVTVLLTVLLLVALFYTTSVTRNLHEYEYELPFQKGDKHQVVQGYGGLFSHSHIAAIDFEMPIGTPVCAAREGVVYSYKDNSDEGGVSSRYKNKANYIIIKHKDGSFGCYWHLQKDGVLVKKGNVSKGQQIGLSGGTGLVLRPHLHFSVKRVLNYQMNSFVRTKFKTSKGLLLLSPRETYERPIN